MGKFDFTHNPLQGGGRSQPAQEKASGSTVTAPSASPRASHYILIKIWVKSSEYEKELDFLRQQ